MTHAASKKIVLQITALVSWLCFTTGLGCTRYWEKAETTHRTQNVLSELVRNDPKRWGEFEEAFRKMHEALQSKRWTDTYVWRVKEFKDDVSEELYVRAMERDGGGWELLDWEVLSVDLHGSALVRAIVKYIEKPGPITSYNCVVWRKEADGWRCEEAGPAYLPLFRYSRFPGN